MESLASGAPPVCRAVVQLCGGRLEPLPNKDFYRCVACGREVSAVEIAERGKNGLNALDALRRKGGSQ